MATTNIRFSRLLLKAVQEKVKQHFPEINLKKDAWVWTSRSFRDTWEFHGPEKYFDSSISASNAYEARAHGWSAWLRHKGIDDEDIE